MGDGLLFFGQFDANVEFDLGRLHHRKLGGLLTLEDAIDIISPRCPRARWRSAAERCACRAVRFSASWWADSMRRET